MRFIVMLCAALLSSCAAITQKTERLSVRQCLIDQHNEIGFGDGNPCVFYKGRTVCPESTTLSEMWIWQANNLMGVVDPCEKKALALFKFSGYADSATTIGALACGASEANPILGKSPNILLLLGLQYLVYKSAEHEAMTSNKFQSSAEVIAWLSYARFGAAIWNAGVMSKVCL